VGVAETKLRFVTFAKAAGIIIAVSIRAIIVSTVDFSIRIGFFIFSILPYTLSELLVDS
jgi:hypothetical protein